MHSATSSDRDPLTLHEWQVGKPAPQENGIIEEELVGMVIWSPNSNYVFVDTGTSPMRGELYLADGLKSLFTIGYNGTIYFSPDSKKILFSGSEGKTSSIKDKYVDPSNTTNLGIYTITTRIQERLFVGTDTVDYKAIGWLDNQTISYDLNKYSEKNGEFKHDRVKYKYDLSKCGIR